MNPKKKKAPQKAASPKKKVGRGKGGGRPRAQIRLYFEKMLPFLQRGLSVAKACEHAGVPKQTVSDYMRADQKFADEIAVAQRALEISARNVVAEKIQAKNLQASQWYLERKCKDEFSLRVENVNENHDSEVVVVKLPENGREETHPDNKLPPLANN